MDGSKLALGAAGILAAIGVAKVKRGSPASDRQPKSVMPRSQAGSSWADDRPARIEVKRLYDAITATGRDLALEYAAVTPHLLSEFVGDWASVARSLERGQQHRRAYGAKRDLESFVKKAGPPPLTDDQVEELIENDEWDGVIDEFSDAAAEAFADYARTKFATGWIEMPPAHVFHDAELLRDQWLIHQSSSTSIDMEGFRVGVGNHENLGYTGSNWTYQGQEPGFNFAYHPGDYNSYGYSSRGYNREPKYGKNVYVFWVPWAVRAWHYGDQEPQVMFWGPSAKRVVLIGQVEQDRLDDYVECWVIQELGEHGPCFDTVEDLVYWLEDNWRQYQRVLFSVEQRRRRRVERGWATQQVPGQHQVTSYGYKRPKRRTVYRGPKKGTPR